jgi:MFS family permease
MSETDGELTNVEKMRGLPWGVLFSVTNSVFVQYTFFGSVFVLFLSELGLNKSQMGGLLSLLPFFGLIALFVAPTVARFGYKRTFILAFGARKAISALLLLTPWVLVNFGSRYVIPFIVVIVAGFAICRSIAMTAFYPWVQEYVPDALRGKYTAIKNSAASLSAFIAVTVAGYVIGASSGLQPFMTLIAIGLVFGVVSVWSNSRIPGGAPMSRSEAEKSSLDDLLNVVKDSNLLRYLVGVTLVTLATVPLVSFLPLFMKEQVGLSSGNVVLLQTGTLLGGLLTSYLWGWAADRYGSKPVMLSGVLLQTVLPVFWFLMPRHSSASLPVALGIALLQGLVNTSWMIGSARLLYVSVVPDEKRSAYMAVYYAWTGVASGLGQLLGGWVLELFGGLSSSWLIFTVDPYTALFAIGLLLPLLSIALFRSVRPDSEVSMGEFAGMFLRGNPILAMGSLIGYHRAKSEREIVSMTERLGQAKSPLATEELEEALADPRFYVRFEAIVSIARGAADPQLTEALIEVLQGKEPALSVIAAWALGRMGDERALEALRAGLNAPYRSVQAHCARSLGTLGDVESTPILLERIRTETDIGLRIAYAAALGKLGGSEAAGDILSHLRERRDASARKELALALARLVGEEHHFIQLFRHAETDLGTAAAQALGALDEGDDAARECADAFAHEDLDRGVRLLAQLIRGFSAGQPDSLCALVLQECADGLEEYGAGRVEYLILALHALECRLD